jgi:S1-C subfamily serine protease
MIGGDIIIGIDDIEVKSFYDLTFYIERTKEPDDIANLKIIRGNNILDLNLKLGVRPPP